MQIRTITEAFRGDIDAAHFDDAVNILLGDGWQLTRRELLQGNAYNWETSVLYAELAKFDEPDPQAEPQPLDPFEALRAIKCACVEAASCDAEGCLLHEWCQRHLDKVDGPCTWVLPGEEAPEQ